MSRLLVLVPVLAMLLAGCLDTQSGSGTGDPRRLGTLPAAIPRIPIPEGWSEAALPYGGTHSHNDHSQHFNLSTANFDVLGYNPLITDYHGRTSGSHLCGDAKEKDGRRLSVVHSFSSDIAFILSDVTDPREPKKIGELAMPFTHVYDLAITPDFRFVLLATSPLGLTGPDLPDGLPPVQTATFRDECTGEERTVLGPEAGLPYASGIVLVDISNPRTPNVVDFRMFPILGGHSVTVADVNGKPLILASIANLAGPTNYYVFMDLMDTAAGPKLNILHVYNTLPVPGGPFGAQEFVYSNHDGIIHKHPLTNQWLAYLAYGDHGLVILNIDDPRNPRLLGSIVPWATIPQASPGYIHEAVPIDETWDGRHYTFLGDECGGHPARTPTCLAYAIDTTDPTKPTLAGAWTLPHDVGWSGGLQFSLHYLGYLNQTLFVTVYHGGLWAVDVSGLGDPDAPLSLPSIGVFMPPYVSPKPPRLPGYSPRVNDLNVLDNGDIVVYDAWTGLYMVRFDDQNPAPPPEPWTLTRGPR